MSFHLLFSDSCFKHKSGAPCICILQPYGLLYFATWLGSFLLHKEKSGSKPAKENHTNPYKCGKINNYKKKTVLPQMGAKAARGILIQPYNSVLCGLCMVWIWNIPMVQYQDGVGHRWGDQSGVPGVSGCSGGSAGAWVPWEIPLGRGPGGLFPSPSPIQLFPASFLSNRRVGAFLIPS